MYICIYVYLRRWKGPNIFDLQREIVIRTSPETPWRAKNQNNNRLKYMMANLEPTIEYDPLIDVSNPGS